MARTRLTVYAPGVGRGFWSAISLHSHTRHSKEGLNFLPALSMRMPTLGAFVAGFLRRCVLVNGRPLDLSRAYWCPPLGPLDVFRSEENLVAARLGMRPLVSITDHDAVDAGLALGAVGLGDRAPVSLEWTVPYMETVFHLGIHNLPAGRAQEMLAAYAAYTRRPSPRRLSELLAWTAEDPATLIVLNHPFWKAHGTPEQHDAALTALLSTCRAFLHATEVNGYRSWVENRAAVKLGEALDMPVIAGGDRHGRTPSALLNVSSEESFDGFVGQIRRDRRSDIVVMPEYLEHRVPRIFESTADVFRYAPDLEPGGQPWTDRVFLTLDDGTTRSLSEIWSRGGPWWLHACAIAARTLGGSTARSALRFRIFTEGEGGSLS
jgi:predicted metal-dependent phosphoesterase TrpH